MKKEKILGVIMMGVFLIFALILIIQLILKIIGYSPTDIQILYIGFGTLISYLLVMSYKMGTFVGEVREFMNNTKTSFSRLKEDSKVKFK